ncbi:hypothetical protein XENTR_v10006462 [Xenopus tropicalis]|nr:hypothetical protein XENTR_v10006462 [Xenopus tropicalis]
MAQCGAVLVVRSRTTECISVCVRGGLSAASLGVQFVWLVALLAVRWGSEVHFFYANEEAGLVDIYVGAGAALHSPTWSDSDSVRATFSIVIYFNCVPRFLRPDSSSLPVVRSRGVRRRRAELPLLLLVSGDIIDLQDGCVQLLSRVMSKCLQCR